MLNIPTIIKRYNWKTVLGIAILSFLLLYPYPLTLFGISLVNPFIKERFVAVGLLFLVLRGLIHDYYASVFSIFFLVVVILSPVLTFGQIVFITLLGLVVLKLLKKI